MWVVGAVVLLVVLGGLLARYVVVTMTPSGTAEKERPVVPSPPADAPKTPPADTAKKTTADAAKPAPDVKPTDAARRSFRDCDVCPAMVALPSGTFMMGSPTNEEVRDADEGPQHLTQRFFHFNYTKSFLACRRR